MKRVFIQFLKTTTLHGFKYLCSAFYVDRIGWLVSVAVSACCAGVLCAVLWARFLEVPALLELRDMRSNVTVTQHMPEVVVCPPAYGYTKAFLEESNINVTEVGRLSKTVESVIAGMKASEKQVKKLELMLRNKNLTLTEMMLKYSPPCEELIKMCRWQRIVVPCKALFDKELTNFGACCVMRSDRAYYRLLEESDQPINRFGLIRTLDLSLQCSDKIIHGCKFLSKYESETNTYMTTLTPGYIYFAVILFQSVPMSSSEEFLTSECNEDKSYSREICLDKCAEQYCGCTDPVREIMMKEEMILPPCSITQLGCLRSYGFHRNISCKCLPSCNKMQSAITIESLPLNLKTFTIDPLYESANSNSTVIYIRLNIPLSKIFTLNPTETWLTLLSSLGGVFNMFLGVGMFSALEMLLLFFIKLPVAFLRLPYQ